MVSQFLDASGILFRNNITRQNTNTNPRELVSTTKTRENERMFPSYHDDNEKEVRVIRETS